MAILLVTTPILVGSLGTDMFGVFVTVTALTSYLAMSDLGIGAGLLTVLGGAAGRGDQREMARLVTSAAWLLILASLAVGAVGLSVTLIVDIPQLLGAPPQDRTQALLAFQIFVLGFAVGIPLSLGARVQSSLQQGAEAAAWLSLGTGGSAAAAAAAAVATGSVVTTMLTSVGVLIVAGLLQSTRVVYQHPWILAHGLRLRISDTRGLMSSSIWLFGLQLSAVVAFQTDILIVASVLGSEQAAVFHGALRAFALVSMVTTALASQFWPATAEALAANDHDWVRGNHRRLAWQLPVLAATVGLFLVLFGRQLIGVWLGESLVPPLSLLIAFAVWTTYTSFLLPYSQVLNAAGILKSQLALAIPMVVLNLALSFHLTKTIGPAGAPLGSLLAHVLIAFVPTIILVRRALAVPPSRATGR